jgi:hypothetical protein
MATSCRFCGVSTHLPHETQEACITALHAEIARLREIMYSMKSALADSVLVDDPKREASVSKPE